MSTDEMAFALTLFVAAAGQRISAPRTPPESLLSDDEEVCEYLYRTLCADLIHLPAADRPPSDEMTGLYTAFVALCSYYDGDPLQAAVCARVLAFHFLMERSAGAALTAWVTPLPETPEFVDLHPAVIEALATVRLHGSILLSASSFLELVASKAAGSSAEKVH